MKFLDEAKIYLESGKGGAGCVAFHRAKYVPEGGPDGGNGGRKLFFRTDTGLVLQKRFQVKSCRVR